MLSLMKNARPESLRRAEIKEIQMDNFLDVEGLSISSVSLQE